MYRCEEKQTQKPYAVKVLKKTVSAPKYPHEPHRFVASLVKMYLSAKQAFEDLAEHVGRRFSSRLDNTHLHLSQFKGLFFCCGFGVLNF